MPTGYVLHLFFTEIIWDRPIPKVKYFAINVAKSDVPNVSCCTKLSIDATLVYFPHKTIHNSICKLIIVI